jgi:putative peptide zinc metalloprotease protein
MAGYAPDSLVTVRSFNHRFDGDTVIIGDTDRQVFLAIPAEGLDILDALAAGRTVGEAVELYEEKHHETPDIEDFLEALEQEGFIGEASAVAAGEVPEVRQAHWRWRFSWISPRTAQRLVSRPVLAIWGVIVAAGVVMVIDDPSVMPYGGNALLFPSHIGVMMWTWFTLAMVGLLLHELGHVVAARAAGVPTGLGVGNQLWMIVAQTDMTSIWLAPKRQRYLAFAAGSMVDAVASAFLIAFIWPAHRGLIHPPQWTVLLATALLLTNGARMIWQFAFFLRTDVYYIVATANKCKNLMSDTTDYMHNLRARLRGAPPRVDQSGIPAREMRVIRRFAWFWVLGRLIALGFYGLVIVPVLWRYSYQFMLLVTGNHTRYTSFDFATFGILVFFIDGGGLVMWLRGLYRGARARRRLERSQPADGTEQIPKQASETADIAS